MTSSRILRHGELQVSFLMEIITRTILTLLFFHLESAKPFERRIQTEELWLYKNPTTFDYVPTFILWRLIILPPLLLMLFHYFATKEKNDLMQSFMALSLALGLNGVITNIVKIIVGRPRPDFLYRCFHDGVSKWPSDTTELGILGNSTVDITNSCTGYNEIIQEGRKSFPSGSSSFSFCALSFLSLWLCGKLQVLSNKRGSGWRLFVVLLPLLVATSLALSRTYDYHNHWQDVLVGSLLGMVVSYTCYRQYYPSLSSPHSYLCYLSLDSKQQLLY